MCRGWTVKVLVKLEEEVGDMTAKIEDVEAFCDPLPDVFEETCKNGIKAGLDATKAAKVVNKCSLLPLLLSKAGAGPGLTLSLRTSIGH